EVPSFDEPEPESQPLPNYPPLNISLGDEIGLEPPIKPHSLDGFGMKVVDPLTIHTPPLPYMASFHPKDMYCYYHPYEVEETIEISIEVKPFDQTQLEDLGLNTFNHDIPFNSREVPSFDEPEPESQPLPNYPPLNISLGDEIGLEPPIKPHSLDGFGMKVVDPLTIHTPPLPYMASFHPKDMYCYYHPCIDP
nr:hypothetical protein [Tanacetum cinerariifolium]